MNNRFTFTSCPYLMLAILLGSSSTNANTLYFDSTFGSAGFVNQSLNINASCAGVVVGPNPSIPSTTSITVAGTTELSTGGFTIFLSRYSSSGVLDTSFGSSGYATISNYNAQATSLSLQADGKLVVSGVANIGGMSQIIVARFTSAGVLDGTFGSGGVTLTPVPGSTGSASYASLIDQNQQLVIAGSAIINGISTSVVARYTTAGVLDGTFGTGGIFTTTIGAGSAAQALVLDSSNNIVVGGYALNTSTLRTVFAIFRLTTAGALDGVFGSGGVVTTVVPNSTHDAIVGIGVQSTGAIVVVGNSQLSNNLSQITLTRYTSAGILDTTFGSSGFVAYAPGNSNGATSMLIQASNSPIDSIVVAGTSDNQFLLARFTSTGAVDTTFGVNGTVLSTLNSFAINNAVAIQTSDGKLVTAGSSISQDQTNQNYTINRNLANNNDIIITNVANAQVGYTATPTLTGNVAPIFSGSGLVQLILDGVTLSSTVPIASDGSWSYVVSTSQTNGPHTLIANLLNPGIIASITSNFAIVNTFSFTSPATGNLNLMHTAPSSDLGVITKAGIRFLHDYSANSNLTNVFLGSASGNFTANSTSIQNTAVGAASSQSLASGADNTAFGYQALLSNVTGDQNVAVGSGALQNNLTSQNTAVGYQALNANTTGTPNTAVGFQALALNTTGANNIAIGYQALRTNASGSQNIAIGELALQNNKVDNNIAIGQQALQSNQIGISNISIGPTTNNLNISGQFNISISRSSLGQNITGSFNTAIGNGAVVTGLTSFSTLVGSSTYSLGGGGFGDNINALGYQALFSFGRATPGLNTAIGYQSSRLLSFESKNVTIGANAMTSNRSGGNNTAIGQGALGNLGTSTDSVAIGLNAMGSGILISLQNVACGANSLLALNNTNANTAIGFNALAANNLGDHNTAIGINALLKNTTGINNTAIGDNALNNLASGIRNVAIGSNALLNNASGSNTIIGYNAMTASGTGGLNTAIGAQALALNASSSQVAIGTNALGKNTTGGTNTAIGTNSLNNLASGRNNFAAGLTAGTNYTTGESNNVLISHAGVIGESNTIRLGTNGTHTATFIAGIRGITTVNNDAAPVLIDSAGQLGTISSSARFKENIRAMDNTITTKLAQLRPVSFNYISDQSKREEWGLIAEEVSHVLPGLVVNDENGIPFTVRYHILPSLLLKGWQENREQIQNIPTLLDSIRAKIKTHHMLTISLHHSIADQQMRIDELISKIDRSEEKKLI